MIGYIILGATVAAFLTLGAYGLARYLRGRDRYEWPTGQRTVGEYAGTRAHLVAPAGLDLGLPREDVAHLCAIAAACVADVADVRIASVCVHVLPDIDYDRVYGKASNGRLDELRSDNGANVIPLVAIRYSQWGSTLQTGSLVVHELTHHAIDMLEHEPDRWDNDHSRRDYFGERGESVEAKARALFVELKGKTS